MGKQTIRGKIVMELLDKFPNASSNCLAQIAFEKNPAVYKDAEAARSTVRYYRGANGKKDRVKGNHTKYRTLEAFEKLNKFDLPASEEHEYLPYYLDAKATNMLCLYDIHVPYHNIEALTAALTYGLENKVNTIFLGGDFHDFYGMSYWQTDPRERDLGHEIETGKKLLAKIRKLFPKARIYYLMGNHEERLERLLQDKAPQLLFIEEFRIDKILGFKKLKIELIDKKRVVEAGKLKLVHGHEFGNAIFSPVNPARGLYMKAKESTICGHHHQSSEHTEPSISGDVVTCWSTGCLCELSPPYRPLNKWNHGFAHVKIHPDGDFDVYNKRVIKGKVR